MKPPCFRGIQNLNCANIHKNVMYISYYYKLTTNCAKTQGVSRQKKEKFFYNCAYILKIAQNVSKIATI